MWRGLTRQGFAHIVRNNEFIFVFVFFFFPAAAPQQQAASGVVVGGAARGVQRGYTGFAAAFRRI